MESAVLDSDSSHGSRSTGASLTEARGRDATVARGLSTTGNGVVALPYPDVLPVRPARERQEPVHGLAARTAKRAFDLVGAILLLVILAPAWLVVALSIRIDSPGPVLFRQRRIGQNGEAFWMFKFRTMFDGADARKCELLHLNEAADGLFKINGDPRITKVGAWLRSTSLDELPQLLNVVTGRMSLVGPRPLVPEEDATILGEDRRRLAMRPGMTGVWQVNGASTVPIREMVGLDRGYLEEWSLWLDVKILLKTARLVALRQGV